MKNAIFYTGVATLLTHELDAMTNREWRVLPLLRALPDATGAVVFVIAHIPLFAVIIALLASENPDLRRKTRYTLAAFLVIHGMLHAAFMNHVHYEFESLLSEALIFGGAALGIAFMALEWRDRRLAG